VRCRVAVLASLTPRRCTGAREKKVGAKRVRSRHSGQGVGGQGAQKENRGAKGGQKEPNTAHCPQSGYKGGHERRNRFSSVSGKEGKKMRGGEGP